MPRYSSTDARITINDDGSGRLHISWQAQGPAFLDIKESFRSTFPRRSDAVWCSDSRSWSVPGYLRPRLARWVWQVAEPEAVCWDDAGASGPQEARSGRVPVTVAGAYRALHLTPDAPLELAEHVYRWHAKHTHPDVGGSHQAAVAINDAINVIREAGRLGAA